MKNIERRSFSDLLLRSEENGDKILEGRAIVYNKESHLLNENGKTFREVILPGALTEVLSKKPDIRALWMHNKEELLGRTKSGTLELVEDNDGVLARLKVPNTNLGNDLYELTKRGDINQMSFAFSVGDSKNESWSNTGGVPIRTLRSIPYVYDISFVTDGAYEDTTVAVRSLEEFEKTIQEKQDDTWKIESEKDVDDIELIKIK